MPKKHRRARRAYRRALADRRAAEEQQLPPPPAAVTPIDAVAQTTEGVREQQLGLWAQQNFDKEAELAAREQEFLTRQQEYEEAYAREAEAPGGGNGQTKLVLLALLGIAALKAI